MTSQMELSKLEKVLASLQLTVDSKEVQLNRTVIAEDQTKESQKILIDDMM